jgi:excisionase family DNA binding protein
MTTIPFAQRLSCTIDEACEATGIGRTKLYEEISAGRVQTTNVGRRRLILVPSLLTMLDPTVNSERATRDTLCAASGSVTRRTAKSHHRRGEHPTSTAA